MCVLSIKVLIRKKSGNLSYAPHRLPTSLNLLCHSKTDARFMQDSPKAVWSIPSLKQNFIVYHSSSRPDCIFEIQQLWQSGFSRVYSNSCCSCSFEPEIIKIGRSSHMMYSNNIVNFQIQELSIQYLLILVHMATKRHKHLSHNHLGDTKTSTCA